MRMSPRKLKPREVVVMAATAVVLIGTWGTEHFVFPAYDEVVEMRERNRSQAAEFARLGGNLAIRQDVDQAFQLLGEAIKQTESDQITLSRLLRDLERTFAKYPDVRLTNVRPDPVEDANCHKVYRVKLDMAAKLPDLLKFIQDLTGGTEVVGMEGFSLRGVQGVNMVECSLSLRMIRLTGPQVPRSNRPARTKAVRKEAPDGSQ